MQLHPLPDVPDLFFVGDSLGRRIVPGRETAEQHEGLEQKEQ